MPLMTELLTSAIFMELTTSVKKWKMRKGRRIMLELLVKYVQGGGCQLLRSKKCDLRNQECPSFMRFDTITWILKFSF